MTKKIICQFRDVHGMPRAYAVGPADRVMQIRELAVQNLEAYCARHSYRSPPPKPADFSEYWVDLDEAIEEENK